MDPLIRDRSTVVTIPAPIETEYRGHRFRSRLEARWAVAFDHLGVEWKYEPQGYHVGHESRPYLPDFRLPGLGVWAEVKGDPLALDKTLMDDAAGTRTGLPGSDPYGEKSMLILGDIPPSDEPLAYLHWMVSRTVYAPCESFCACADARWSQVTFRSFPAAALLEGRRHGQHVESPGAIIVQVGRSLLAPSDEDVVTPRRCGFVLADRKVLDAFRAARLARFEHGEKPSAA
jgi:hypothetical protein